LLLRKGSYIRATCARKITLEVINLKEKGAYIAKRDKMERKGLITGLKGA
jgi:hypothetical protein